MPLNKNNLEDELLVAILNNMGDFNIIISALWYRIPVSSVNKLLIKRWPPKWLAFYHTSSIKTSPFQIKYYGKIDSIKKVKRHSLFPDEPINYKSHKDYIKITLKSLEKLEKPILSRRWRRIIFIQTKLNKFINAIEINDLFDGSKLEDILWAELKRNKIYAERQELIQIFEKYYFLDFAIYCQNGKIDVETDGDLWHHNPNSALKDNERNNDIISDGWRIIRFSSNQIKEKISSYCVPHIKRNINKLGGLSTENYIVRKYYIDGENFYQTEIFEELI